MEIMEKNLEQKNTNILFRSQELDKVEGIERLRISSIDLYWKMKR
jgi:hypothetical protein